MKVIGLMSGTSADGIDAALLEIGSNKGLPKPRLLHFAVFPFPDALRERILRVADAGSGATSEICRMNVLLGELFAKAAISVARRAGVPLRDVTLIGSHGQTIAHFPNPGVEHGVSVRSTLQIGEPSIIAERTGVTTVADFRPRDMAAGGEGAPLTPYLHALLFRHLRRDRIVLNLGGIANLTFLPKGRGFRGVLAFDTGPGNVLIDGLVARLSSGAIHVDLDGRIAGAGEVNRRLLRFLMAHPYLKRRLPKSTGRDAFGPPLIDTLLHRAAVRGITEEDMVATVTAFTAESVALHVKRELPRSAASAELITCGGGANNPMLIKQLQEALPECRLLTANEARFPGRAIEASAFALLAYLTAHGLPGNLPRITGATHSAILGKIIPGRTFRGLR
ncbi:MAG: anhydro-N-acetylmuramic acid kinase [candidate division NC10 bacterium]|nr:anhydro-N-acetylmuramic acid kinase [candidate division NC10 bacterium]MDE2320491.1 anhydro-N-acetylmuramic acid kinase [candidate division NC10 bacterium]